MTVVAYDPNLSTVDLPGWKRDRNKLRYEVFSHYCGGVAPFCQCEGCRVDYMEFLQLDHLAGVVCVCGVAHETGNAHRKAHNLGTGADRLWRWARANGYPAMFQVLCCNCNHAKFNGPACPLFGKSHVMEGCKQP